MNIFEQKMRIANKESPLNSSIEKNNFVSSIDLFFFPFLFWYVFCFNKLGVIVFFSTKQKKYFQFLHLFTLPIKHK